MHDFNYVFRLWIDRVDKQSDGSVIHNYVNRFKTVARLESAKEISSENIFQSRRYFRDAAKLWQNNFLLIAKHSQICVCFQFILINTLVWEIKDLLVIRNPQRRLLSTRATLKTNNTTHLCDFSGQTTAGRYNSPHESLGVSWSL